MQHIDEGLIRVVNVDFGYLGEEDLLPILVGWDSVTKSTMTLPFHSKHASDESARRVSECFKSLGFAELVMRSDQEPALLALRDAVAARSWASKAHGGGDQE